MDNFEKFYLIAVNFLSYRPRSEKEIRDKLNSKNSPQDITEKIINTLTQQKFLNDQEFARIWISNRTRINPKSKKLIKIELLQKGVSQEIIEKALAADSEQPITDIDQAQKLVQKKLPRYKNLPKQEIYQKIGGFLARRGFDWTTIKKAIDLELSNS